MAHLQYTERRNGELVARKPVLILDGEPMRRRPALLGRSADVVHRSIDDIAVDIRFGSVRICEVEGGRDLLDFSSVRLQAPAPSSATLVDAMAHYLHQHGVQVVNPGAPAAPTKLSRYVRLASRGIRTPKTIYLSPRSLELAYYALTAALDVPFVMKSVAGGSGAETAVVARERDFVDQVRHGDRRLLAQELVPVEASYQVLVLGRRVKRLWRATAVGQDVLPRPCWDSAEPVEPAAAPSGLGAVAIRAAAALDYGIALVHVVQHWTTGEWLVLDAEAFYGPFGVGVSIF